MRYLGVFAKYWQPGEVKSRLAADIGPDAAATLYRNFVTTLLDRLACTGDRRMLAYSPADRLVEFQNLLLALRRSEDWSLDSQSSGNLGNRMEQFFNDAFAAGASQVVLLGSDSPNLPTDLVDQAFSALGTVPVVLGPTTDGGYYLVGVGRSTPPIFADIAWSTSSVFQQTIERLTTNSIPYHTLPEWYDVDHLVDLRRLQADLTERAQRDATLRSLTAAVATALVGLDPS